MQRDDFFHASIGKNSKLQEYLGEFMTDFFNYSMSLCRSPEALGPSILEKKKNQVQALKREDFLILYKK